MWTVAGHGTKTSIDLGRGSGEIYSLDISDQELAEHLRHLSPDAVIFLYSCSTGEDGPGAHNLANSVTQWAYGRTVIAAADVLFVNRVEIKSLYPLDVMLRDEENKKDITYRPIFNPFSL